MDQEMSLLGKKTSNGCPTSFIRTYSTSGTPRERSRHSSSIVPFFVSLLAVVTPPRRFPHAATSADDDCDDPFPSRGNTNDKTAA
jgi:hypothetical protein